ncbi:MAG: MFS transporter [Candidatus Rokubacteria bacterium]|nr:MFS transporter [Candidatus Rokubacteria bacterium]
MPVLLAAGGALIVSLDSAVNIAFPAISAAFGVDAGGVRWVIICYVLTYAVTAFAAGAFADRVGPAAVFTAGLVVSTAAYLAYLLVPSYGVLLGVRVLQGLGGGLVYGTAPALVTLSLPRERHGRGLGRLGLGLASGLAIGPVVGGALVERWGWVGAFVFRAPLSGVLAIAAAQGLRRCLPPPATAGSGWRTLLPSAAPGQLLLGLGLAFLANHAQFTVWLLVPYYLLGELGLSAAAGGWVFLAAPLGAALGAPLGGWATDRLGTRVPLVAGLVVETAGLLAVSRFEPTTSLPVVVAGLGLVGVGLGAFQTPNLAMVMQAYPREGQGVAGGLAFLARTLGIVGGVQVASAIFGARVGGHGFTDAFASAFLAAGAVAGLAAVLAGAARR